MEVGANSLQGGHLVALGSMESKVLGHHLRVEDMLHGGWEVKPLVGKSHELPHDFLPSVHGGWCKGCHGCLGLLGLVSMDGLGEWWVGEEVNHGLLLLGVEGSDSPKGCQGVVVSKLVGGEWAHYEVVRHGWVCIGVLPFHKMIHVLLNMGVGCHGKGLQARREWGRGGESGG